MIIEIDNNLPTLQQLTSWGITNLVFDSNEVKKGSLFCALSGNHTDGHQYLAVAVQKGAIALLISDKTKAVDGVLCLLSGNTRRAMASLSSILYDKPSTKIKTIGVTGTDGKSTSVYLIEQLLELSGHKTGLISTVNFKTGVTIEENLMRQSTPEANQIEEALQTMLNNHLEYAVIEATSHGLSNRTERLSQIQFCAGLFTNVTLEHLEFHGTVEQYREDKANLFRKVAQNKGVSVINLADPYASLFINAAKGSTILTYGSPQATLFASNVENLTAGNHFTLHYNGETKTIFCPLPGVFNVENAMGALLLVSAILNKNPLDLAPLLLQVRAPKGRMVVVQSQPFTVIVDYAHTPGSFEKLLPTIKATCKGRLMVVFGSGGERNLEKRPLQGSLADTYANLIFLTDEDPRLEDSMAIIKDIAKGIHNKQLNETLFYISNREEAIKKAFSLAQPNDVILLLGKGHESCIIGPNGKITWDEEAVARKLLTL